MSWITVKTVCVYLVASFISWYSLNTFEYYLNGGSWGRGRWWVFECFYQDFLENIPNGIDRKVRRLRERVGEPHPNISGVFMSLKSEKSWTYEEFRNASQSEQRECAVEMLTSPVYFWGTKVFLYFFCGPLIIAFLILKNIVDTLRMRHI